LKFNTIHVACNFCGEQKCQGAANPFVTYGDMIADLGGIFRGCMRLFVHEKTPASAEVLGLQRLQALAK
jgi:hypothetical protein